MGVGLWGGGTPGRSCRGGRGGKQEGAEKPPDCQQRVKERSQSRPEAPPRGLSDGASRTAQLLRQDGGAERLGEKHVSCTQTPTSTKTSLFPETLQ